MGGTPHTLFTCACCCYKVLISFPAYTFLCLASNMPAPACPGVLEAQAGDSGGGTSLVSLFLTVWNRRLSSQGAFYTLLPLHTPSLCLSVFLLSPVFLSSPSQCDHALPLLPTFCLLPAPLHTFTSQEVHGFLSISTCLYTHTREDTFFFLLPFCTHTYSNAFSMLFSSSALSHVPPSPGRL